MSRISQVSQTGICLGALLYSGAAGSENFFDESLTLLHVYCSRLAPKRASKIRKLFNLTKDDDVRHYVIRREIAGKDGKKGYSKAAKIQRLVTPQVCEIIQNAKNITLHLHAQRTSWARKMVTRNVHAGVAAEARKAQTEEGLVSQVEGCVSALVRL
eukprot:SAG31_NODE_1739_length_7396_cov_3.063177_3_plen_157_part_00